MSSTVEDEMLMLVQVPDNWLELHNLLFADPWPEHGGTFHSALVHRGLSHADYAMRTSLERNNLGALEISLLRNFRKYSRMPTELSMGQWDWLTLAQHHGLPTRVLDWTFSPLVALHFATSNVAHHNADGAVWSIDFVRAHELLSPPLRDALVAQNAAIFTTELLTMIVPTLSDLDSMDSDPFLLLFEPPSIDDRIVNQFAVLSVMAGKNASTQQWVESHDGLVRKIVIPARLKPEARERLDQANMTERVLFPGLDGLSAWLTRYYTSPPRQTPDPAG